MKNIHVLPTDKPTWLHKSTLTGVLRKSSSCIDDMKQAQGMNISITSDEEIKEGDWYINTFVSEREQKPQTHTEKRHLINHQKDYRFKYCKKIILTTDVDLIKDGVQAIDDEFLEWFVKNPSCEYVEVKSKVTKDGVWTDLKGYVELPTIHSISYKIIIPSEEVVSEYDIMPNIVYGKNVGERIKIKAKIISKEEPKPFKNMEKLTKVDWEKFKKNPIPNKKETLKEVIGREFQFHSSTEIKDEKYVYLIDKHRFKIAVNNILKWQQERMYSEEEVFDILIHHTVELFKREPITLEDFWNKFKNK